VDFLVAFAPGTDLGPWMSGFFDLKRDLEDALGRPVDLVMPSGVKSAWFRREVERTRRLVYAA
jgi:predicted nucleotidyltransferase